MELILQTAEKLHPTEDIDKTFEFTHSPLSLKPATSYNHPGSHPRALILLLIFLHDTVINLHIGKAAW